MLMDEPFGAIDPINRERLQNEFLRLQAEIRKTVLFVTHDIDEAIKMGDRIAIMREGGRVAQYATPAELLMAPADEFVEDFVGADRALKRLALMRVADIDLWEAPLAHVGQPTAEVRAKLDRPTSKSPTRCWSTASAARSAGSPSATSRAETVPGQPDSPLGPLLDRDDVMRDALADLLQGEAQYAAVVDHEGRIDGVLSVEIISEFLASPEAKTRGARRRGAARMASPVGSLAAVGEVGEGFFQERTSDTLPCQATEQALLLGLGEGTTSTATGRRPCSTSNWS